MLAVYCDVSKPTDEQTQVTYRAYIFQQPEKSIYDMSLWNTPAARNISLLHFPWWSREMDFDVFKTVVPNV